MGSRPDSAEQCLGLNCIAGNSLQQSSCMAKTAYSSYQSANSRSRSLVCAEAVFLLFCGAAYCFLNSYPKCYYSAKNGNGAMPNE